MKRLLKTLLCFILLPFISNGQKQLSYVYDNSGNRTGRSITLKAPELVRELDQDQNENYFEDALGKVQMRIYPNPVKSTLKISISGFVPEMYANCMLFNISGMMIEQRVINEQEIQIDMSNYQKGHYVLQIVINGEKTTWKIIKE